MEEEITNVQQEIGDAISQSPFAPVAQCLARIYWTNYWVSTGVYPPDYGVHDRIHSTEWFNGKDCPGILRVRMWCQQFAKEIS